jgi:diadenosine tetraphosphate (Ap4A) HIT family hydrolase
MATRRDKQGGSGQAGGADAGGGTDCPFCSAELRAAAVAACGTVFAVPDAQPVAKGHVLVVTVRHTADLFTMTDQERLDADRLLRTLRDRALSEDPSVTGFNVGANCGVSAGQRIMHAHIHFIPRRKGQDVKGVIRNKMAY